MGGWGRGCDLKLSLSDLKAQVGPLDPSLQLVDCSYATISEMANSFSTINISTKLGPICDFK